MVQERKSFRQFFVTLFGIGAVVPNVSAGPKDDEDADDQGGEGWRNSYAPNEGYQNFGEGNQKKKKSVDYERRRSSLRRNSSILTEEDFKKQAYGMLRKQKNPNPNFSDKVGFAIYRILRVYVPVSSILALTDFVLDWKNAVNLMTERSCSDKISGLMMFLTVVVCPMVFALVSKSYDEYDMWEEAFRDVFCLPEIDYFSEEEQEDSPWYVKVLAQIFYVFFSPFTHLVTQMMLHTNDADKVEYYLEFDLRKTKVMRQLHLGSFTSYDEDELDRLKTLQWRATHYVQYYMKYAKDRLRYCLVEDTLQFNFQFAMFMLNALKAQSVHPSDFQNKNPSLFGISVNPETALSGDVAIELMGILTSILMLWQGYFQIEKYHEQLTVRNNISIIRVFSIVMKATIELVLPPIALVLVIIHQERGRLQEMGECTDNNPEYFVDMLFYYVVFFGIFSYGINTLWAFILNVSNKGRSSVWQIFKETMKMSVFTSCLSVKYNRIADHNEQIEEPDFKGGVGPTLVLALANVVRFLPTIVTFMLTAPNELQTDTTYSYVLTNDIQFLSYMNDGIRYTETTKMMKQRVPVFLDGNVDFSLPVEERRPKSAIPAADTADIAPSPTMTNGIPPGCFMECAYTINPKSGKAECTQAEQLSRNHYWFDKPADQGCYNVFQNKWQTTTNKNESTRVATFIPITPGHLKMLKGEDGQSVTDIFKGWFSRTFQQDYFKRAKKILNGANKLDKKYLGASMTRPDDFWFEAIVTHDIFVLRNEGEAAIVKDMQSASFPTVNDIEFARYFGETGMILNGSNTMTTLMFMSIGGVILYTLFCVMTEPRCPTSKMRKWAQWKPVTMTYYLWLPLVLTYISMKVELSAMDNSGRAFCQMYPHTWSQAFLPGMMWTMENGGGLNCINQRGGRFKSIDRCTYGVVCWTGGYPKDGGVDDTENYATKDQPFSPIHNNPNYISQNYAEKSNLASQLMGRVYLHQTMRGVWSQIRTNDVRTASKTCLIYKGLEDSSFGEVIFDHMDSNSTTFTSIRTEAEKCQDVFTTVSRNNKRIENFYTAVYDYDHDVRKETWEGLRTMADNATIYDQAKFKAFKEQIRDHLFGSLECYKIHDGTAKVSLKADQNVLLQLTGTGHPVAFNTLEKPKITGREWFRDRFTFEDLRTNYPDNRYNFFENWFHGACRTGLKLKAEDSQEMYEFINGRRARESIAELQNDVEYPLVIIGSDGTKKTGADKAMSFMWPQAVNQHTIGFPIDPLETSIDLDKWKFGSFFDVSTKHAFFAGDYSFPQIMDEGTKTAKTIGASHPDFADFGQYGRFRVNYDSDAKIIGNTDMDSANNLPLFNPYYHFAFDVYGTETLKGLQAIPFESMGRALNEIYDNIGPWMVPYEPPNVGPAATNALPSFRMKNDRTKMLGNSFEASIINLPRDIRLDTGSSTWHYYIHAILFPFSAPLPWWTETEDPDLVTIQRHVFGEDDAFFGNAFNGKELVRQITPELGFLYTNYADKMNPTTATKTNSYFNVPIWAHEFSNLGKYAKSNVNDHQLWKMAQPEYTTMQDEGTPFTTDDDARYTGHADLTAACAVNIKDNSAFGESLYLFGIGSAKKDKSGDEFLETFMRKDTFGWTAQGRGNRQRFRKDEDYLLYGPGGEGLKRTVFNPTIMQYEFDSNLRDAIRAMTYNGNPATANWDDGMGHVIDQELDSAGLDKSDFKLDMTLYLFTNLMTHLWPMDYDYRYKMPYSYYFDVGKDSSSPGEDKPFSTPCQDGKYTLLNQDGTETGKKMWCIGGPVAFDPNSKPTDTYDPNNPMDLRDVTLGRVYKPQAEFIRQNTDFFPFMDLGDPFINQDFAKTHRFGLLNKFWDTPSRLKMYDLSKPYSHYRPEFEKKMTGPNDAKNWYKPFINVNDHADFNLKHVNTHVARINGDGINVTDYWDQYSATNYGDKIKTEYKSSAPMSHVRIRMSEPAGSIVARQTNERSKAAFDLDNWQQVYARKNKESLTTGWHFFGREWNFDEEVSFDESVLDSEYFSEVLDVDYSMYNSLPTTPIYVRTAPITDRDADCMVTNPDIDIIEYKKPMLQTSGKPAGYCDPNVHYLMHKPDFWKDLAMKQEDVAQFNPTSQTWHQNKTYTHFNKGSLHINKPCVKHNGKAFVFAQVRRLKPFYYFYCDKWINDMTTSKVNLATDGGKISTRPCSKKVVDPLNRFQPWDSMAQTAFADTLSPSDNFVGQDVYKTAVGKSYDKEWNFIVSDPEIVSPYSLVFQYDGESDSFSSVEVLPDSMSPQRGSCISSTFYKPGALLCFGGLVNGRVSNIAMGLTDVSWKSSVDPESGLADLALPLPLIDHTVVEAGTTLYLMGGKSILWKFQDRGNEEILDRGKKFLQYGYNKQYPIDDDSKFVNANKPMKLFHKVSGEQMYPPIFDEPDAYGYQFEPKVATKIGLEYEDYKPNDHIFVLRKDGFGWERTEKAKLSKAIAHTVRPVGDMLTKIYVFDESGQSLLSRYPISFFPGDYPELTEDGSKGRRRRSADIPYAHEREMGRNNPNVGPFLSFDEEQMIYAKEGENYFPTDWSSVMSSFFGTDDSGAQMCKMCDLANRKISMHKLHMSQAAKDRSIADKIVDIASSQDVSRGFKDIYVATHIKRANLKPEFAKPME